MVRFRLPENRPNQSKFAQVALRKVARSAAALTAALFVAGSAWALQSCPIAPSLISQCCVAAQAGQTYVTGPEVDATGSCFKISARNVIFDMNGTGVLGQNKGIGVHVLSTAPNAVLEGEAVVSNFATAVQSDAPNTILLRVESEDSTTGFIFKGPGVFAYEIVALANTGNGVVLKAGANDSMMFSPTAEDNANGIVIKRTTGVALWNPTSIANTGYGVWLKSASFNSVIGGRLEENTIAGAYLGCHADGPNGLPCATPYSNHNTLVGMPPAEGSDPALMVGSECPPTAQNYGIAIDKGNGHNHVYGVRTDTSCSPDSADQDYDGYDGNGPNCRGNIWLGNSLYENQTATSAHPFCMN